MSIKIDESHRNGELSDADWSTYCSQNDCRRNVQCILMEILGRKEFCANIMLRNLTSGQDQRRREPSSCPSPRMEGNEEGQY